MDSSSSSSSFVRHSNPFIETDANSSSCPSTPTVVLNQEHQRDSEVQSTRMPSYRIRRMRPEDVPAVLEIWAANDLHEGLYTIQSFMAVDPDGFVVAVEVEEEEEVDEKEQNAEDKTEGQLASKEAELQLEVENNSSVESKKDKVKEENGKKKKKVVVVEEEVPIKSSGISSGVGLSKLSGILNRKQICCCSVQGPASPPPSMPEELLESQNTSQNARSPSGSSEMLICRRKEKRILGMCACVFVHSRAPGFIGLYGVRPELHGRGIGLTMWRRIMEHVGPTRSAALYAVPQHLAMYRDRAGFRRPDDRLLFIYESDDLEAPKVDLLVDTIRGVEVVSVGEDSEDTFSPIKISSRVLFEQVARFDAFVHGYPRTALLEKVLFEGESVALVALDVEEADEQAGTSYSVLGYGCLRTNNIGKAMMGPLYATNDAAAELLMRKLFEALPGPFGQGLLYMTLDSNPGGERIADKLGLVKHEELPRFFLGEPYGGAKWEQVYCIHSPNFSLL